MSRNIRWFGVLGGLLWAASIVIEYSYSLQPPSSGALFSVNQAMFAAALACWTAVVLGIRKSRLAGVGKARHLVSTWALGYALLTVGILASLILYAVPRWADIPDKIPLAPLGGILAIVSSIGAGFAIARAGRVQGARRWIVLGFAGYVFVAMFVPVFFGIEVDAVRETIWGLWWVVIGVGLF